MVPVVYQFITTGQSEVQSAFGGVTQAAIASAAAASRAGNATAAGARVGTRALREEGQMAQRLVQIRAADSAAVVRASQAAGRAFDAKMRAGAKATAAYEKNLQREVQANERAEAKKTAATAAAAQKRERAEARSTAKVRTEMLKSVAGGINRYGGMLAGRALTYGSHILGAGARESIQLGDIANTISIKGRMAGGQYADPKLIKREIEAAAVAAPGIKSADLAAGVMEYLSKTGDMKTARELTPVLATAGLATGTDPKDLASATAALAMNFDFQGLDDFKQALATLTYQGKQGAFELEDAAERFMKLGAAANAFDIGKGGKAVAMLGGLSQIAFKGTGSASVATTSLENVFKSLVQHSVYFKSQGAAVYDKTGGKRSLTDILPDVIAKVGGTNLEKKEQALQMRFGSRGYRAIAPLYAAYRDTVMATKGSDADRQAAGRARVAEMIDSNIKTIANWNDVLADAAQAQKQTSNQLTGAWERMKQAMGPAIESVMPELIAMIPQLTAAFASAVKIINDVINALKPDNRPNKAAAAAAATKEKTAAQGRLDDAIKAGAPPEQIALFKAQVDAAGATADRNQAGAFAPAAKVFGKNLTPDEFEKEYMRRGDGSSGLGAPDARYFAGGEQGGESGFMHNLRGGILNATGTVSQKDLVEQYGIQLASERASKLNDPLHGGQATEVKGAGDAQKGIGALSAMVAKMAATEADLGRLQKAAGDAAAALAKVKPPNVPGEPQAGVP